VLGLTLQCETGDFACCLTRWSPLRGFEFPVHVVYFTLGCHPPYVIHAREDFDSLGSLFNPIYRPSGVYFKENCRYRCALWDPCLDEMTLQNNAYDYPVHRSLTISNNSSFRQEHPGVPDGSDGSDGTSYPLTENYTLPVAQATGRVA